MTRQRQGKTTVRQKLRTELLFELPEQVRTEPQIQPLREPIWTENKAKLIERYLFYFVLITKHGTYIDGFAGPQVPDKPHMWAAKLVLESEPRWLRNFFLFESNEKQITFLRELKDAQPPEPRRKIRVMPGDFNIQIARLLASGDVRKKEACFCLLDQQTFECHWESLERLARYKTSGPKIELFYFLPNHWFKRALSALRDEAPVTRWWGRRDWECLYDLDADQRKMLVVRRFKDELGYHSVKPWPIYERRDGGRVMYYMVHATDHPSAPELMARAYNSAVLPREPVEQLLLELGVE